MTITITGAECTGKTTLVRALAVHYGVPWVPEAARVFVERVGRQVRRADVPAIVILHRELVSRVSDGPFVLCDTDLISTVAYARHYFGSCPREVTRLAMVQPADLYLLAADDLPWVADPGQRGTEAGRARTQARIRTLVRASGRPMIEIRGRGRERFGAARRAIDDFLCAR